MVRASAKMCERHLYILTYAIEWCNCKIALCDIDLLFGGQTFKNFKTICKILSIVMACFSVRTCVAVCYNRWHRSHFNENQKCKKFHI